MRFPGRAVVGGAGVAGLCAVFPPITAVAIPAYAIACIFGKRRDNRLERESSSESNSNQLGDYDMNSIVRRRYEPPYTGEIFPLPPSLGLDFSPETMIASRRPKLAAGILSKQIGASIMQTGADVLRDTTTAALYSGRDFKRVRVRMRETERLFGLPVRSYTFKGRVDID